MSSEQWNIDNLLSPEDRATCEKLAADRAAERSKPGTREHFEDTVARCEAQQWLNQPFDESEAAVVRSMAIASAWHAEAVRQFQRNQRLTRALWVAAGYGAFVTLLFLWRLR
jgi:hypothetical protein